MPHIGSNAWTFTYQCWPRYLSTYDLPTVEMNVVSASWHYCLRRPIGTWWQVDYIGFLPFWKSQWFILIGTDTHSDIFFWVWVWLSCSQSLSQYHHVWTSRVPDPQEENTTQASIPSEVSLHNGGFSGGGHWLWSPLIIWHIIPCKNFWPDKALGWSFEGAANMPG